MPDLQRPGWARRIRALRDRCAQRDFAAFVVSHPVNLRYLTGFTGSAGLLVCTPQQLAFVTDGRYEAAVKAAVAEEAIADVEVVRVEQHYEWTLGGLLTQRGLTRVGFEAGHVTVATLDAWRRAAPAVEWGATEHVVEAMRAVKDSEEIATFRKAGAMLSGVARRLSEWVQAGRTERSVARDIEAGLESAGFSGPSFETIVASGPNSAHPHARPGGRRLAPGDLVVLDFGGVLDGYCVDLTRMARIGEVGPQGQSLLAGVRAAHAAAIAAVRPGVLGADVDRAAREALEARGLGEAFLHGTGHGLGLEVHEAPRVSKSGTGETNRLEPGSVITIEPGAYVQGVGGVRLEDDVLVTENGCELLTDAPLDAVAR